MRGTSHPLFLDHIRDLISTHKSGIFILVETKISEDRAAQICRKLSYSHCEITNPVGYEGGVWLLWNSMEVDVVIIHKSSLTIHAFLKVISSNHSWILRASLDGQI